MVIISKNQPDKQLLKFSYIPLIWLQLLLTDLIINILTHYLIPRKQLHVPRFYTKEAVA